MRKYLFLILFMLLASAGFGQSLELVPSNLVIPAKFQKYYDTAQTVYLPKGFTASVYYTGTLATPRFMAFEPGGALCVADLDNASVVSLPDLDTDGVADTAITIATGIVRANSIAFHGGYLFSPAPDRLLRYSGRDASGHYTIRQDFINGIGAATEGDDNHTTRTIVFDDPSNSLYVSVGSPCNACREKDTTRASIIRYDQDGTHQTIYATGLRNAVGLAMDSTHHLWATVAERNDQGQDVPRELITAVDRNANYGWPISYGDHRWDNFDADSEYRAMLPVTHADTLSVASMRLPDATVDAHSTPLGIAYYQDTTLPRL